MHQPALPAAPRHAVPQPGPEPAACPTQGAPSQDPFQWPEASTPYTSACGLEATPGPPATEECQPSPRYGSASPGWPPPALGSPQVPSPAPAGGLCAGHLPGAEPQPPPLAAGWVSWPTGLSPHGPQQPPQLWLTRSWPYPCLAQPGCCASIPELHLGPQSPPSPLDLLHTSVTSVQALEATPSPPHPHQIL